MKVSKNIWVKCPCCGKDLRVNVKFDTVDPEIAEVVYSPCGAQPKENH
jgi:hypothetical protein